MSVRSYIIDDRERQTFLLDREVLVSEDILRKEMAQQPTLLAPFNFQIADSDLVRAAAA